MTAQKTVLKLPIGIQTFDKLREGDFYYVDKTPMLHELTEGGGYYFLSRPRRFGKSLLLDTIDCLYSGRENLFEGLFIQDKWDWQKKHPVVRISFNDGVMQSKAQLDERIGEMLTDNAQRLDVALSHTSITGRFDQLIQQAHQKTGQRVVVLIDEYDKPILDNITDAEKAREQREGLKNLYTVLKGADEHLEFVLLTGVSKFSKVSLFSGLNNLRDITLSAQYTSICGYTDADLDSVFAPELPGLDRAKIKHWYNGYRWGGPETTSVYNPFDVLLLLKERKFKPYWFETATPTFLVDLLKQRGVFTPQLDAWQANEELLSRFDVDDISTEALLFQTGYLTLQEVEEIITGYWVYTLGYPNREVEASLNRALLPALGVPAQAALSEGIPLIKALQKGDTTVMEKHLKALFAAIPHDWHRKNPIANYEGYYASVFYSHLAALGLDIRVEDACSSGRVDVTLCHDKHIYLFEFKVNEQVKGNALQQIKDKGYANKYRAQDQHLHLIGVDFSKEQRQIIAFEVESLTTQAIKRVHPE